MLFLVKFTDPFSLYIAGRKGGEFRKKILPLVEIICISHAAHPYFDVFSSDMNSQGLSRHILPKLDFNKKNVIKSLLRREDVINFN
jgi:hypothetical protein